MRRSLWKAVMNGVWEASRWLWGDSPTFGPPRDVVSLYQTLRTRDSELNGRILLEDQGTPEVDPGSILVTGGYRQHREQPWPIFWSEHQDARLVSSSLALILPEKVLCLESVYGHLRFRDDPVSRRFCRSEVTMLTGNWTSIVSRWVPTEGRTIGLSMPNFTHWLLDALPRLALIAELPEDVKIIVPADLHKNQIESLSLLGLWDRCRPTSEQHLLVEKYYFSSPTSMLQGYNPYGIDFLRREFLPKRDQNYSGPKRFFLRRLGLSREASNTAQLEKFFEERGWVLVDPVGLTFGQQVQLFHEAEAVSGMFGSAFTNAVFCRPGCKVVPIMPTRFGMDGFLDWIAQVVGFKHCPFVFENDYSFQYSVDLEALKKWVDEVGA